MCIRDSFIGADRAHIVAAHLNAGGNGIAAAVCGNVGKILLLLYRVDVKGLENLPKHSVLLCPNHSTDLDPVLIGLCLPLDYHLHFMEMCIRDSMNKAIVVIGGGAGGMMAAICAARKGAHVTLLDPNERLGKKRCV